jgi:hypothetical protein
MLLRKLLALIPLVVLMQGCLVFHSVSYEIIMADAKSGTVTIQVTDIRSDAMNTSELEEDKKQLFQDLLKGDDFVNQMRDEGKNISNRQLYIFNGKLNGTVKYSFEDVAKVEGIVYQEPFYFITINPADSIISTNGEVIVSEEHKRIMWDNSIKTMKFEMFSADVSSGSLVELTKYLEEE